VQSLLPICDTALTGAQVTELQNFLIAQKLLTGEATGNFYGLTQKAVKAFQTSEGLPSTGFVGPMTRSAISKFGGANPVAGSVSSDPTDQAISALQVQTQQLLQQLNALTNPHSVATSSIVQTFTTDAAQFDFDPTWTNAIVNLLCMDRYGESASSGSGVIIDPRGIILTNAHVAESFLFAQWPSPSLEDCYVRTGSPAQPHYRAALMYIPDEYMVSNINEIFQWDAESSVVYGKKDYALLVITGASDPSAPLPVSFPYLDIYQGGVPGVNTPVFLSGYSAEFASYESLMRSLYLLSSGTSVAAIQPIGSSTIPEAISFSGNIASQHGVSGGAVIGRGGQLMGLMTFLNKDYGQTTGDRVLNAITTDYIQKDFASDNNMTLASYLAGDPVALSKTFLATIAPKYQQMYIQTLKEKGYYVPGAN